MTPEEIRQAIVECNAIMQSSFAQMRILDQYAMLEDQIKRVRDEIGALEVEIQAAKEEIYEFESLKAEHVGYVCDQLAGDVTELLPFGDARIQIKDDKVIIGWVIDAVFVPYSGLSGGQKVIFDMALGSALIGDRNKVLVIEAAEIDNQRLMKVLEHTRKYLPEKAQVIVNTCHEITPPEGWHVIRL